jgi:gas vesicle protein
VVPVTGIERDERDTRESEMDAEGGSGKARTFAAGLILGALVGAGLALLLAPQSGADTRRSLARKARHLADDARDRYDDARQRVRRARELRQHAKDEATAE